MDEGTLQAKIEKWVEETPPMKRFIICFSLVFLLSLFMVGYWDWANLSSDGMMSVFMLNIFAFFFVFMPLSWLWKKMKSN